LPTYEAQELSAYYGAMACAFAGYECFGSHGMNILLFGAPHHVIICLSMKITCPICKTMTTWEENPDRPFCSERCRLIDLGKWASGEYQLEGERPEESAEEGEGVNE